MLLRLRHPRAGKWNPFRIGILGQRLRRRPDELWIPVFGLSASNHVVAHAIAKMVEQAGGTVETKPPGMV